MRDHRDRGSTPTWPSPSSRAAGGVAGLVAGVVYLVGQMILSTALGLHGAVAPLQRIAATLMGPDAIPPGHVPGVEVAMGGLILAAFSLVAGLLIGHLVRDCAAGAAALRGAAAGLVFFALAFFVVAPEVFPWFVDVRNAGTAVNQMLFGAIVGWLAIVLRRDR